VRYTLLANGVPDDVAKLVKAAVIVAAVWLQGQWEGLSHEENVARRPFSPARAC
jgi:hypothetical protein